MAEIEQIRFETEHSPDEVWQAINTPLVGELSKLMHPLAVVEYEGLTPEEMIGIGTLITYGRDPEATKDMNLMGPKDANLRVHSFMAEHRARIDLFVSPDHNGNLIQAVEEVDGSAVLTVQGELNIGGKYTFVGHAVMPFVKQGISAHYQRIADNIPIILDK